MHLVALYANELAFSTECKWSAADFDAANIKAFRRQYPKGSNFVVASDVKRTFSKHYGSVHVKFVSLESLIRAISDFH